ncbi:MAG: HAMP domain-containing histidine kinase [Archangium sp.]|nr:HAMP domain-containing histidine kinase [Archangium sp.]
MKWVPRIGLLVLLVALAAFEALFMAERARGHEALTAERTLRSTRATELLHEELQRQFDVADTRLEALETLPLLEEDGLLWIANGVQRFPRVAGVLKGDDSVEALGKFIDGDERALDAVSGEAGSLSSAVKKKGSAQDRLFRGWPWLERKQAAELCVRAQRAEPRDTELVARCQRALAGVEVKLPTVSKDQLVLLDERWLVRASEGELRGVELNFEATLARVSELLARRAVIEAGETVSPSPSGRGSGVRERIVSSATDGGTEVTGASPSASPLELILISPRLDAAESALTSAFWWKSLLLALTALLGVAVVLLMRLAEARERATLALQRDFISTVSHELRTPLAAIRVLAETLERKLGTAPAAKDYPKRLVAAVDGLGFLVENILSFNRIESGRVEPKRESLSLASLETMLREDIALVVERPVALDFDAGLSALGSIDADVTLLRILVLNLLRNTWKYSQRDAPKFSVRGRVEGSEVVLTFADDGPGIPADARERVFEPFHRQPEASNVKGSGLGLALARRIAELHRGTLRISASSSGGTTFELRLPRASA